MIGAGGEWSFVPWTSIVKFEMVLSCEYWKSLQVSVSLLYLWREDTHVGK